MAAEDSVALEGFLRGVRRRARLFAHWQAGDPDQAAPALASAEARFLQQAPMRPLADWPRLFWRALLDAPALRMPLHGPQMDIPPGIARQPHGPRAVLLLGLVAGLDDDTAAAVLGTPVASYRLAREQLLPVDQLGRPDMDVWNAWKAAALRAQAGPEVPLHGTHAHVPRPGWIGDGQAGEDAAPSRRGALALLWVGVAACAAALVATFLWSPSPELSARLHGDVVRIRALGSPAAPRHAMDATEALCMHPDLARLEGPALEPVTTALAFHAWFAAQVPDASVPGTSTIDPGLAREPAAEPVTACEARMQAMPQSQRGALEQAVADFDALPPASRRAPRERWLAWWALPEAERLRLLQAASAFVGLPAEARTEALAAFRALPATAQYGWRLGPELGASQQSLQPLLAQVPEPQRDPLLAALRGMTPPDRETLARLAASVPPEQRQALREDLLAVPAFQRGDWLLRRLALQP